MPGLFRPLSLFLLAWTVSALFIGCPVDPGTDLENPAGVVLERAVESFVPGQELTVTVTIDAEDGPSISAIGLTESVPEGWLFVSASGDLGQRPAVTPAAGDSGNLGFIWITVPEFPISFTYTLQVPENAVTGMEINGRVDYYQALGLLSSDDLATPLITAAS